MVDKALLPNIERRRQLTAEQPLLADLVQHITVVWSHVDRLTKTRVDCIPLAAAKKTQFAQEHIGLALQRAQRDGTTGRRFGLIQQLHIVAERATQPRTQLVSGLKSGCQRRVLDLLGIDADTPLSITTDGRVLFVAPVRASGRRKRTQQAIADGNRKYSKALKKLSE